MGFMNSKATDVHNRAWGGKSNIPMLEIHKEHCIVEKKNSVDLGVGSRDWVPKRVGTTTQ